jgi:hypothetical protein
MVLNTEKTFEMRISTKQIPPNLKPLHTTDGKVITIKDTVKLLGCLVSNDMKWNDHVSMIVSRASQGIHLLTLLKRAGTPEKQLILFYNCKIRSLLSYAFPSMCNMPRYLFLRLVRIENRAFKIIGSIPLVSLEDFVEEQNHKLANKCLEPSHRLHHIFETNRHGKLRPPFARTTRFKNSFICKA